MQSVRQYKKLNLADLNACANAIGKVQRVFAEMTVKLATMFAGTVNRQTLIV